MKRKWIIAVLLLICFFSTGSALCVFAEEVAISDGLLEQVEKLLSQLDLEALQAYMDALDGVVEGNVGERLLAYIQGQAFDYNTIFQALNTIFFQEIKNILLFVQQLVARKEICLYRQV